MSGANFLALSSPQFESATVRIGQYGAAQGGTLTVSAPGASDANRYIQRVSLNGRDVRQTSLDWSALAHGGTLAHQLGSKPSSWGTSTAAAPPSVNNAAGDLRRHVDASLRQTSVVIPGGAAQQVHLDLDVLAQNPVLQPVTVSVTAPWKTQVQPVQLIWSGRLPVQQTVPITVNVPAGAALGTYPVQVKVAGLGANTVTRSATVEVRTPSVCVPAGTQCAVDLARDRNHDGTATVAASTEGNFDGGGWSYDAALLPPAGPVVWDGVTYAAPDASGTSPELRGGPWPVAAAPGRTAHGVEAGRGVAQRPGVDDGDSALHGRHERRPGTDVR